MEFIDAGNGHYVNADRILAITTSHIASGKRALRIARDEGLLIDFTHRLTTMALILCDNGVVIRSCKRPRDLVVHRTEMNPKNKVTLLRNNDYE